jgi:hypothetical protein
MSDTAQYVGTLEVTPTWWEKNKKWVWPVLAALGALVTGNGDRLDEFVPGGFGCTCTGECCKAPAEDGSVVNRDYSGK